MGIFFEQVEYINRDCIGRSLMYDGQRIYLRPNYNESGDFLEGVHNFAPKICIPYALNQNVVLGTEDPVDPSEFESHVVPLVRKRKKGCDTDEWRYEWSFLPSKSSRAKTRVPLEEYLDDPSLKVLDGRGPFRVSESRVAAVIGGGICNQSVDE